MADVVRATPRGCIAQAGRFLTAPSRNALCIKPPALRRRPRMNDSACRSSPVISAAGPGGDRAGGEDFGARDPFPGELATSFGEKSFGLADTEHRILMPKALNDVAGLASWSCSPLPESAQALSDEEARELLKRVVGWRLLSCDRVPEESTVSGADASGGSGGGGEDGLGLSLQGQWRVRDEVSGDALILRVQGVAEREGQTPRLWYDPDTKSVHAQLRTAAVGGLSVNDFILAAKIDQLDFKDLTPKARFWA